MSLPSLQQALISALPKGAKKGERGRGMGCVCVWSGERFGLSVSVCFRRVTVGGLSKPSDEEKGFLPWEYCPAGAHLRSGERPTLREKVLIRDQIKL